MLLEICLFDAYGACFEYNEPNYIRKYNTLEGYVPHQQHPGVRPGQYTDDGQMSIGVGEVMLENDDPTALTFANKFVDGFHRDQRYGYAGRFYEFLCKTKSGEEFLQNIMPVSEKSGAAMRAGVLGLLANKEQMLHWCEQQAIITHNSNGGILSAKAASLMVHYFYHVGGHHTDLAHYLEQELPEYKWTKPWRGKVSVLGINCVHAAVTAIVENDNAADILKQCISYTGDVDTVAAIAGGPVSVARSIKQNLPQVLFDGLENGTYGRDYVKALDVKLLNKFPATFQPENYLIDIDGTICEDIRNEESERYPTAKVYKGAVAYVNGKYDQGHRITFFTARESKDREVTMLWLNQHGFKFHQLIMDKPRSLHGHYRWVDNVPVTGVLFKGSYEGL